MPSDPFFDKFTYDCFWSLQYYRGVNKTDVVIPVNDPIRPIWGKDNNYYGTW